jgi:hypothetical protein
MRGRLCSCLGVVIAMTCACTALVPEEDGERVAGTQQALGSAWEIDRYGLVTASTPTGVSVVTTGQGRPTTLFWADATDPSSAPTLKWTRVDDALSRSLCTIPLPTPIEFGPSAVATADPNVVRVFYGDAAGTLWFVDQDVRNPGPWCYPIGTPVKLSNPGLIDSAPAAVFEGGDGYSVFYKAPNGVLTRARHRSGQTWWDAPESLGVTITSAPTAVIWPNHGNMMNVFYRNSAGELAEHWWSGVWHNVGSKGAGIRGAPSAVRALDDSRLDVYFDNTAPPSIPGPVFAPPRLARLTYTWTAGWALQPERLYPGSQPGLPDGVGAPYAAWDQDHVFGIRSGGLVGVAPREQRMTRKVDAVTPKETTRFSFSAVRSSSITGGSFPTEIRDGAPTIELLSELDPRSSLVLLTDDTYGTSGVPYSAPGLWVHSFFDKDWGIIPRWVEVPYTYPGNGPAQTIDLTHWNWGVAQPIRTMRVYDHGECYAHVGLSSLFDEVFSEMSRKGGTFSQDDCLYAEYDLRLGLSPRLYTSPWPATDLGAETFDSLQWDIQVTGDIRVKFLASCLAFGLGLDTRLTHGFSIVPAPGGAGTRVELSRFTVTDGKELGQRAPGYNEDMINFCTGINTTDNCFRDKFPKEFASKINSRMIMPQLGLWALSSPTLPLAAGKIDELPLCDSDKDCTTGGPEDGCFFTNLGKNEIPSTDVLSWELIQELDKSGKGLCVSRLEPKRVNITPGAVDIVLAENANDPHFALLKLLGTVSSTIKCSSAPQTATDPYVDTGGEFLMQLDREEHVHITQ